MCKKDARNASENETEWKVSQAIQMRNQFNELNEW